MPIKLIGTIILLILVTIFAGVNLDNKCDITFIFYTFHDVPVFMTVVISFAIGLVLMLPFTFGRKKKPKKIEKQPQKPAEIEPKEESKTLFDFKIKRDATPEKAETGKMKAEKPKKEKKPLFGRAKKEEKTEQSSQGETSAPTAAANSPEASTTDAASTGAPV